MNKIDNNISEDVWLGSGGIQYLKTWRESMVLFILIISAYVRFNRLKRKTMRA